MSVYKNKKDRKMTVINEKLVEKLTKNDTREVSMKELKALNKISIKKGYNKNIYFHKFFKDLKKNMLKDTSKFGFWNGENTKVFLQPLMFHKHKGGVECETHMRCSILTPFFGMLLLDIPVDDYDATRRIIARRGLKEELGVA